MTNFPVIPLWTKIQVVDGGGCPPRSKRLLQINTKSIGYQIVIDNSSNLGDLAGAGTPWGLLLLE